MQVSFTPEEYIKLQESASAKEVELAMLRREVEWLRAQAGAGGEMPVADPAFITLKVEDVCKVLDGLKGPPQLVALLFLSLMKMLPEGTPLQTVECMMAAASLDNLPLSISTTGDMNVLGTYNNVTGNANVNF